MLKKRLLKIIYLNLQVIYVKYGCPHFKLEISRMRYSTTSKLRLLKNWEHFFLGENVILNTSGILHIPQMKEIYSNKNLHLTMTSWELNLCKV